MNEQGKEVSDDSKYFSQRAKHISLSNKPTPTVPVQSSPFQFSNRTFTPCKVTPIGRGNSLTNESRPNISVGRGRTTVPLSPFVLQKDNSTTKLRTSPIFVMHDEVQFVRPYFGPRKSIDTQSASISRKREILLSALKEIESGLKSL